MSVMEMARMRAVAGREDDLEAALPAGPWRHRW